MRSLKELRKAAGLTQSELAEKTGLRQATVSALENGRSRAQSGSIHALASALNQPPAVVEKVLASGPKASTQTTREAFNPETLGDLQFNWHNAKRATEGHTKQWKEAMMFLDPILKRHPEFLEARRMMRIAAVNAALKIPISDRIPPPQSFIGRAQKRTEENSPLEAIEILEEKVFVYLPTDVKANLALYTAASAADLPQTAQFAIEFAATHNQRDKLIFQRLAEHYRMTGQLNKACDALQHVTHIDPTDLAAQKSLRDAMAEASMKSGTIEKKDTAQAASLEKDQKIGMTSAAKQKEIHRLTTLYQQTPDSPEAASIIKRAIALSLDLGQEDTEYLERAYDLQETLIKDVSDDPVLYAQLDQIKLQIHTRKLAEAENSSSRSNDDPAYQTQKAAYLQTRFEIAERNALTNPTNAEAQLEYGESLINLGKLKEAVKPLQKAKKDPRGAIDIAAMILLSDCFLAGSLTELALKEIEAAITKINPADGNDKSDLQWKDLHYRKALILDKLGQPDQAKTIFADIYAQDSEYRDVEERVWMEG